ncbi:hypothetical protein FJV41_20110 [Myxococcus llanfairpwllgwyngyllgogerychwyrndrobwllllantysiliogogogochensis]|uniref:WGR domain-containing protein n=1 Tax=Myxococcus llanfairpwllgwyngyllgogerychwyrndrobwllllantysiliogogogochensis TaxID=2590453 RepID=A0A540WYV6_9BACT|nr:hypothetical protein [Myxococcus llanfairpwllgwyngyllgogerychwyrndrobwllllantysiliogogogochensis]TQF14191.1 hypothetical protein FJV41_20110 [Myxococcus llanfairpwllgwyngyllgogerychwyrndrobwllllantysiliogogogochensis]
MSDSTTLLGARNVRISADFWKKCAPLLGNNVFLDLALVRRTAWGDLDLSLPEGTLLIGYVKQEKDYLVFLKTLESFLPKSPTTGLKSWGEAVFESTGGGRWRVLFRYGPKPEIRVRYQVWAVKPVSSIRPLSRAKATRAARPDEERLFVDTETGFRGVALVGSELWVRAGSLGEPGRGKRTAFKDAKQARAAADALIAKLRKKGFVESKV